MQSKVSSVFGRREMPSNPRHAPPRRLGWVALVAIFSVCRILHAQDHTLLFSTSDAGATRAVTNWGMGTVGGTDVMKSGLIHMGADQIDQIIMPFTLRDPVTNGEISAASKGLIDDGLATASLAGNKPLIISAGNDVGAWYITGPNRVDPTRWAQCMVATKNYMTNRTIAWAQPFNEPDYGPWNMGSQQDLYDIIVLLQSVPSFNSTQLAGGTTLNDDNAVSWYDAIKSRGPIGTTHALGGSFNSYVNFFNDVKASGGTSFCPELHNVVEAIIGAEYGMGGGIWWSRSDLTRGSFVKACQGQRLGYSEDRAKWTAAAVYRAPGGAVQAFVGGNERMGHATTYRFFSKDRDVFYNGDGPRRDFTVNITSNQERVINITWGADVPTVINGRYIVMNRNSHKVMQTASQSSADGVDIVQYNYMGGGFQQWDIVPYTPADGDQSYHTFTVAFNGKAVDVFGFSYADGGAVKQWTNYPGLNQEWFFEYAGDGWFYIRNRWSGKYLDVAGASTADGAKIYQWSGTGGLSQQWRLIPVSGTVEFFAPAAPAGVAASANALSVQLNWNANTEPDLAGYTVWRGTNAGGPYDIVARGLTNNAFTDKSANQPLPYYYVVKAMDRSLNFSGYSAQVSATPSVGPALVARYAFDGSANDSSGNANHATATGSPAFVAGKYGSAIDLNGTNQYAMLPAGLLASVTNFTIAAWVNWDGGTAWQRMFDFGNGTGQYLFLTPGSGSGTLRFAITTNGAGAEQMLETSPLPVGQWQHVAVTRNGNTARLYTNGVLAVSNTVTIAPASFNPALNYLGKSQYEADPLFNGRLDNFFIYNYALSDTEITRLMNNLPPPPAQPTSLSANFGGNMLNLSWPSNYLGCRLESNSVSLAATGSWFTISNSVSTNQMALPIDLFKSNVYFRLVYQ